MADTTFVPQTTVVTSSWLQDVNNVVYRPLANLTALRAVFNTGPQVWWVKGIGIFYHDAADSLSADDGWSVIVAADGGRWKFLNPVGAGVSNTVRLMNVPGSQLGWVLIDPLTGPVDISTSTTSGLQEAINLAINGGFGLEVLGSMTEGGATPQDKSFLWCSTGIVFPPMRSTFIRMIGVHVLFTAAVTGNGMTFDSCMEVTVDMRGGELVYQGTASCLVFAPVNPAPVDPQIAIGDSEFMIGSVVTDGGSNSYLVHMDCTRGPIQGAKFSFTEMNGSGAVGQPPVALFAVVVEAAATGSGFIGNFVECRHIHQVLKAGVQIGLNQTNQATMKGNIWKIGSIQTSDANATGFNSYGSADIVDIADIDSAYSGYLAGVLLEPGSSSNTVRVGNLQGYTVQPVTDSGSQNRVTANGQSFLPRAQVNLGGNNQVIPSGAWTKVALNTVEYDVGGHYDNVNYRWTPKAAGQMEVLLNIAWNTVTVGAAFFVAVNHNGTVVKQTRIVPGFTIGGQSVSLVAAVVSGGDTDYIEVWVYQNSGAPQALDGANSDSWATFKLL